MSFFNLKIIANSGLGKQAFALQHNLRVNQNKANEALDNVAKEAGLIVNSQISQDAYREMDKNIIYYANRVDGGDIVEDLNPLIRPLDIGKTVKLYPMASGISDNGGTSMDGNIPLAFDHVHYTEDGNPVPIFSDAFGANWRHVAGLNTISVDVLRDSQEPTSVIHNQRIANYTLYGDSSIAVGGYKAEGLFNHRNTFKVDLKKAGKDGGAIDLTTSEYEDTEYFFNITLKTQLRNNYVKELDVLWVSPEIYGRLHTKMAAISKATYGDIHADLIDYLGNAIPAKEVKESFALEGNQMSGYVREARYIEVPVSMPTMITPLIRQYYNDNYNFRIDTARGIGVKTDAAGRSGVFYFADLS